MFQIYTGNGKGKTTASIGLGLRAVGAGKKVLMIQFLKTEHTSEVKAIRKYLKNRFIIKSFGRKGFPNPQTGFTKQDFDLADKALKLAKKAVLSRNYDLIILDEINVAVDYGLIKLKDALNLIKILPTNKNLVFTGRYAKKQIMNCADLISEAREIKHPYKKGVMGEIGIEY